MYSENLRVWVQIAEYVLVHRNCRKSKNIELGKDQEARSWFVPKNYENMDGPKMEKWLAAGTFPFLGVN